MYSLKIVYADGTVCYYRSNDKDKIDKKVEELWDDDAEFLVSCVGRLFWIFWEDRYDFGW